MHMLKLLPLLFLSCLLLTSCGGNSPDNVIHGTGIRNIGNPAANVPAVLIKPTWSQANHWAQERADFLIWQILGWVLFIALLVMIAARWLEPAQAPKWLVQASGNLGLFIVAALALVCFRWQASSIKWNNDKWVPRSQYEAYNRTTGPIWDSLEKRCLIVYGPYDCYKRSK
jgi:hypothetical protein